MNSIQEGSPQNSRLRVSAIIELPGAFENLIVWLGNRKYKAPQKSVDMILAGRNLDRLFLWDISNEK
jgi:hypothetical protein